MKARFEASQAMSNLPTVGTCDRLAGRSSNFKTAQALGITIPAPLRFQADEVIR
jgi:hypothetical protein